MSFFNLSGPEFISLASSLSILIADNLSTDEINTLSSFFSALGDNLALLSNTSPTSSN